MTLENASLDLQELESCIEALLFISDQPLSEKKIKELLSPTLGQESLELHFQEACIQLVERYKAIHHGIELVEISGGYQFRTKPGRADLAKALVKTQIQRLSTGAMESLAIIAYKQPLMKEEVDKIRGVDSSYFIRGLMEKKLIQITGRSELPGRPILYGTTEGFLQLFGLKDLSALPSLRELEEMVPKSQSPHPLDSALKNLVGQMKSETTLVYDPKEDEKILKEIREKVNAIQVSSPTLDAMRAEEILNQNNSPLQEMAGI